MACHKKRKKWMLLLCMVLMVMVSGISVSATETLSKEQHTQEPAIRDTETEAIEDDEDYSSGKARIAGLLSIGDASADTESDAESESSDAAVEDGVQKTYENTSETDLMLETCENIRNVLMNTNWDEEESDTIKLDIKDYRIPMDSNKQFHHIGYYCPYSDGENITLKLLYYKADSTSVYAGQYAYVKITNTLTKEETTSWVNAIDSRMEELLNLVDGKEFDTVEKAMTFHDELAASCHYDREYQDSPISYYPSGMLMNQKGVCQAYSYLFQYLMNREGEECYTTVSTETMSHGWNILKVGDSYYHIDITWDDPTEDKYGMAFHGYFMVSDKTLSEDHSGWDLTEADGYSCTDNSYESSWMAEALSPIRSDGEKHYYIDTSGLECYDSETANTELITAIEAWSRWQSDWGVSSVYSGLFRYQDTLFFNSATQILSYDLNSGGVRAMYTLDSETEQGYIYGINKEGSDLIFSLQKMQEVTYNSKKLIKIGIEDEDGILFLEHILKIIPETKATFTKAGAKEKIYCTRSDCDYVDPDCDGSVIPAVTKCKLKKSTYYYSAKVITPEVVLCDSNGEALEEGTDYTLTYSAGRKYVGDYTVTVNLIGDYSGKKTLSFRIIPDKVVITGKKTRTKAFTISWSKLTSMVSGYEIQYCLNRDMVNAKSVKVGYKKGAKTITGLKSGKIYFVRIRTYKNRNSKTYYSGWSARRRVRTK